MKQDSLLPVSLALSHPFIHSLNFYTLNVSGICNWFLSPRILCSRFSHLAACANSSIFFFWSVNMHLVAMAFNHILPCWFILPSILFLVEVMLWDRLGCLSSLTQFRFSCVYDWGWHCLVLIIMIICLNFEEWTISTPMRHFIPIVRRCINLLICLHCLFLNHGHLKQFPIFMFLMVNNVKCVLICSRVI